MEVHCEGYSILSYSMRDVNDDSSSSSLPNFYADKSTPFVQHNNVHLPRNLGDGHPEHERDALKQKMLEHETVFKNQVCELHRLYQIQRDMMEEVKLRDFCSNAEIVNSPVRFSTSKEDSAALNMKPSKLRKIFDLQLPADEYIKETSEPENVTKKFIADYSGSSSISALCLRGSGELVDINEPVRIKGSFAPSVHILDFISENNTVNKSLIQKAKSNTAGFGFSEESTHLSNGKLIRTQTNQLDRYPPLAHFRPNQVCTPPAVHPSCYGKEEEGPNGSGSCNGYLACESSHKSCAFPFLSSFPSVQTPSMTSWVKPGYSFGRLTSAEVVNQVLEPVPLSQDLFVTKMFANSSESISNGFYHGSASGYKENPINLQPTGFNNVASNIIKPSCHQDRKSIDLNEEVRRSPSDDVVILDDLNVAIQMFDPEEHNKVLPWLKPKPSPSKLWCKNTMTASDLKIGSENEIVETKSVNKIMGFVVLDRHGHENELSSVDSCLRKTRMIDINVACDPDEVNGEEQLIRDYVDLNTSFGYCEDMMAQYDEQNGSSSTKRMLEIVLEAGFVPEYEEYNETEQIDIKLGNEVQYMDPRKAAELVLVMSSMCQPITKEDGFLQSEDPLTESLSLLADAVTASENGTGSASHFVKEIDDFEAMTLQLVEITQEHYMPKPTEDNAWTGSNSRLRRGQARRGRPRRDFQRDILPGITSLSKPEMTEDLQIFGCLMTKRNTGRSSSQRGRKRAVVETVSPSIIIPVSTPLIQKLNNMESGSDDRTLTGWGKTTRCLKRQGFVQCD